MQPPVEQRAIGLAGVPGEGNFIELMVDVVDGRITHAAARCHPCRIAETIGRRLVELLEGKRLDQVNDALPNWIDEARQWVPVPRMRVVGLAVEATVSVLNQLHSAANDAGEPRQGGGDECRP